MLLREVHALRMAVDSGGTQWLLLSAIYNYLNCAQDLLFSLGRDTLGMPTATEPKP